MLKLFTRLRGRGILRTSPNLHSRNVRIVSVRAAGFLMYSAGDSKLCVHEVLIIRAGCIMALLGFRPYRTGAKRTLRNGQLV
jgi:hypothetical protein